MKRNAAKPAARISRKALLCWAVASAAWVLLTLSQSLPDVKYGLLYHLLHDRVQADHQAQMATHEQTLRSEEERIRKMLQAARRYERLQFMSLAAKRSFRRQSVPTQLEQENDDAASAFRSPSEEMAALEATYGKATLRKYREQSGDTEKHLIDTLHERMNPPVMRQPRLAAALSYIFGLPLLALLVLWMVETLRRAAGADD